MMFTHIHHPFKTPQTHTNPFSFYKENRLNKVPRLLSLRRRQACRQLIKSILVYEMQQWLLDLLVVCAASHCDDSVKPQRTIVRERLCNGDFMQSCECIKQLQSDESVLSPGWRFRFYICTVYTSKRSEHNIKLQLIRWMWFHVEHDSVHCSLR